MLHVIGEVLPLAFVIALSPIPIVATIVMLLSPRARASGVAFLVGWVVGIAGALAVVTTIVTLVPPFKPDGGGLLSAGLTIAIGVAILLLGVRRWLRRDPTSADAPPPSWLASVDAMTPGRAGPLGLLLAVGNPKNVLLALGAGITIGATALNVPEEVVVSVVFVLVATASVSVPVIIYLVAARHVDEPLRKARSWLAANGGVVSSLQSLIIGVVVIGLGIGRL